MKLTDIDLSSLAEVAAAVTLLEHVRRSLADRHRERNEPLPTIIPGFVVGTPPQEREGVERFVPSGGQAFVVNPAPSADDATRFGCAGSSFGFPTPTDAERLRGQGVDPAVPAQPLPGAIEMMRAASAQEAAAIVEQMDAASVFGGAPAQSAAPLPPAPSTAGVAASLTAPAVPLASGALPTLPALAPLPAPAAAAPAAPAAPSSPAGGVELDKDGLPWDERIHAGTKRKNDDGRWTKKRGLNDPALVTRVVAQLRAQMATGGLISGNVNAQPAQSATPLAALAAPAHAGGAPGANPSTSPASAPAAMPTLPEQPVLPANPTSTLAALQAAMTTASAAPTPTTYLDFMTAATVEVQSGRVPIEAFGAVCKSFGGVEALNATPELIPIAWKTLKDKYPGML